jgi:hypothetical protein
MKLRVTSITASEVGELINSVTTRLEDRLRPVLEPNDYGGGVEQFAIFFVSVDSDPIENERYCCANNRAGRYKDLLTGKMVSFVGIAVPIDPQLVLGSSREALPKLLADLLLDELESPAYAMPKKFDWQQLLADLRAALVVT